MSGRPPDLIATASQTVGPFFHFGLTTDAALGRLAEPGAPGEHIALRIRVLDGEGVPVPDAMVEIWQAGHDGHYAPPPSPMPATRPAFVSYGRLPTTAEGVCEFATVRPGATGDDQGRRLASHVSVCLFARGLLRQVHTRVYFAGDPDLTLDPVLALVPEERRPTLLARADGDRAGVWSFDIRLQGTGETVFFDL